MRFPAKASADFEIAPAGNHVALCNAVVDLGLQPGSAMYPAPRHQVYVRFELPTERVKFQRDGKEVEGPMQIGRTMTASMNQKATLRKFIESWFGKPFPSDERAGAFDLGDLIAKKCLLNVAHKEGAERTYANIVGASPIPRGMKTDYKLENPEVLFSLEENDPEMIARLPEWLVKKINDRLPEEKTNGKGAAAASAKPTVEEDFIDDSVDDIPY